MTIQLIGAANAVVPEVDTNTLALHTTFRPIDFGGLKGGVYGISGRLTPSVGNGVIITKGSIFSLQWISKVTFGRIKKFVVSYAIDSSITIEVYTMRLFKSNIIDNFDASYLALSAADSRFRTTMDNMSGTQYATFSSGSALTVNVAPVETVDPASSQMSGGTMFTDLNPIAAITTSKTAAAWPNTGVAKPQPYALIDATAGDFPIDLGFKDGVILTYDTSATTTGMAPTFGVSLIVEDVPMEMA